MRELSEDGGVTLVVMVLPSARVVIILMLPDGRRTMMKPTAAELVDRVLPATVTMSACDGKVGVVAVTAAPEQTANWYTLLEPPTEHDDDEVGILVTTLTPPAITCGSRLTRSPEFRLKSRYQPSFTARSTLRLVTP